MFREPEALLGPLTTLGLGGPAATLVEVGDADETVAAVRAADEAGEPLLVLAGGSNVVVADAGFDGTVVLLRSSGFTAGRRAGTGAGGTGADGAVDLTVAAGQHWDALVAHAVAEGLAGIECLSGIPGSAGATPLQNVGAYGQEVAETIRRVTAYDRASGRVVDVPAAECRFSYRHSRFRGDDRFVVLSVEFRLVPSPRSTPLRYGELTRVLGVPDGGRAPLADVRDAVLALRRGKGMVLDADDPDTRSVGSFFVNPVLSAVDGGWAALCRRVADRLGSDVEPPHWAAGVDLVKISAAWLIERAGFGRGYGRDGVAISSKHTLALTHRGGGSTAALLDLAREIRDGVDAAFGVRLAPEPVLVGDSL